MAHSVDLQLLATRESEQTEWKDQVSNVNDVGRTLSAFANDLANLGGGYVVCGVREERDEHGFPRLVRGGLSANRLREIEGQVLTRCRERVHPAIAPRVEELPADTADARVLVFIQPATGQGHLLREGDEGGKYFVRVSRQTVEARNGLLRELLVRSGGLLPWDHRACSLASPKDLDLLALRQALQTAGLQEAERDMDDYLNEEFQISPFVPPLCVREPLTGSLRPRNFALLLFGRNLQRFIPGAVSLFSEYRGNDRSEPSAQRHEVAGNVLEQASKLRHLLELQAPTLFDKTDLNHPNAVKYPLRALYECLGNALAHRDYERVDPLRISVFATRIEFTSPGGLPLGVDQELFRTGRAGARWRNQALAWFFHRLQVAQAEGQGIPTILRTMHEAGCPPPSWQATDSEVSCVLPAHPRAGATTTF
ncbi:putative DNA binding domain-containing protein [bacterium]|nr:putative DNA binding domain-containing protein [bacterium]